MIQLFATEFYGNENVGVGRLKAFMEKNNEDVVLSYLDTTKSFETSKSHVKPNCELYGFSMYSNNLDYFISLIDEIKSLRPDSLIVVGSKYATGYYRELLQTFKNIDYVILGDGETALLELTRLIKKGGDLKSFVSGHKNIASRYSIDDKKAAVLDINRLP